MTDIRNLSKRFPRINYYDYFYYPLTFFIIICLLVNVGFGISPISDRSENDNIKVGLALSGGGARGIAHIGVLIALEEENIPIDLIAGCSMGSIVGGLWAAGYSGKALKEMVDQINWTTIFQQNPQPRDIWLSQRYGIMEPLLRIHFQFWKISIPYGLNNGQRISEELFRKGASASYAAHSNFDSLKVPYRAIAVDIREGKVYALGKGSLPQAMRSSMAIPLLFYPALYNNRLMVDGGVLDVLPTDVAQQMGADILIAVDVTEKPNPKREPSNLLEIAYNTIDIMVDAQMERNARLADVLIVPPIGQHPDTRYTGLDLLIDRGYSAAKEKIPEIKKLLEAKKINRRIIKKRPDRNKLKIAKISEINIIGHKLASDNSTIITTKYQAENKTEKVFLKAGTILGYFPLKQGDTFNMDLALDGVENLYATGLFQNVWLELENDRNNKVIINIHYLQLSTRTIGIGANYYSDSGGAVFGQVVPFHFFGLGARFMPFVQYGEIRQRTGVEIANSRFFSTKFIFNGGGFYEMDKPKIYNKKGQNNGQLKYEQVVGQFSFGLQPQKKLLFNLGIRGRRVWVAENTALNQPSVTYQYWSLYGNLIFDNQDHYYFPTKGGHLSLKGESVLNFYLIGQTYNKLMATLDWTISIYKRHSFTPFTEFGLSEKELPVYEKFQVGGPKIIPGYHREEIWGNNFAAIGLNYQLNFYKKLNFQANWAMAEVFNKHNEVKLSKFINGVATGLAISSPVGPIAISYGWGETNREQLYFSLGYEF